MHRVFLLQSSTGISFEPSEYRLTSRQGQDCASGPELVSLLANPFADQVVFRCDSASRKAGERAVPTD